MMQLKRTIQSLITAGFITCISAVEAAPVDITLVPISESQLEVRLRPDSAFDGMVSSLVFTVRWASTSGAHLGDIQQVPPESTYIPLAKSGSEVDDMENRYQVFVGFGMTPMQWIPTNWTAGQEYTVMTITVSGTAEFSLVNDAWTGLNNADYYLALGGEDETGDIYGDFTTVVSGNEMHDGRVTVMPNPTNGNTVIALDLAQAQDLKLELLNAAGQAVWKLDQPHAVGRLRIPLDMATLDKGFYLLRIHRNKFVRNYSVVKH